MQMPFSPVVRAAIVLAAMAEHFTSAGIGIVVYRDDPNDARKRVRARLERLPSDADVCVRGGV